MIRIALWCGAAEPPAWFLGALRGPLVGLDIDLIRIPVCATSRSSHGSTSPGWPPCLDTQSEQRVDLLLALTSEPIPAHLIHRARRGIWRIWVDERPLDDPWAGFEALRDGTERITLRLIARTANLTMCLRQSVVDLSPYSLSRTQDWLHARAGCLLRWGLEQPDAGDPLPWTDEPVLARPTGRALAWLGMGRQIVTRLLEKRFFPDQWLLAWRFTDSGENLEDGAFNLLHPPHDRFWADPWAIDWHGQYWVFFEELLYCNGRGRIVALPLDELRGPGVPRVILERPYHLSYPCLFQWGDHLYMLPETTAAGRVEMYRCVEFPDRWEPVAVLLEGVALHDPTIWEMEGRWWLAGVVACDGAPPHEALHLFHADSPLGPWQAHAGNPVVLDVRQARPAGRVFAHQGKWFRPTQDCTRYGRAVQLNQILELTPERYLEHPATRLSPPSSGPWTGLHSYSRVGRLTLIDLLRRRPWPIPARDRDDVRIRIRAALPDITP